MIIDFGRLNHASAAAPLGNVQMCRSAEDRDSLVSLSNAYERPDALRRMPIQSESSAARKATCNEGRAYDFLIARNVVLIDRTGSVCRKM